MPSVVATKIRRRPSENAVVTCEIALPAERAASSAAASSSSLVTVGISSSKYRAVASWRRCSSRGASRVPPPPSRATADAARAAASNPASERSAVWANPVVSPTTTRIPAPRELPVESSSIRPSSRDALREVRSSQKTSAMSPPRSTATERTRSMRSGAMRSKEAVTCSAYRDAVPRAPRMRAVLVTLTVVRRA